MSQPRWIDRQAALAELVARLRRTPRFALDLEGDGYHRYPEHIALIQIALPDGSVYLLDPHALGDLSGLGEILADRAVTKVMHSADFDLRSLDRDYAMPVRGLVDTAIGAQFCGSSHTGLAAVVEEYLALTMDKPVDTQRLDWSRRPLPDHALRYAANDVAHLLALQDALMARLDSLGRREWVEEECRRLEGVRYAPAGPPEESFRHVRGASRLTGVQLAALREMCIYREQVARQLGLPPGRLLPDALLVALAQGRGGDRTRRSGAVAYLWPGLLAARDRGRRGPIPPSLPARRWPVWSTDALRRLEALKDWRRREAARLGLTAGLVWPLAHLERLALSPDRPAAELDDSQAPLVRQWQWRELGLSLETVVNQIRGAGWLGQAAPTATPATKDGWAPDQDGGPVVAGRRPRNRKGAPGSDTRAAGDG